MTDAMANRAALRELMSELSEWAYCAGWLRGTEYSLWEILRGERAGWGALDGADPRIAELRRLHEAAGGWWRWNAQLNDGRGGKEFLPTAAWEEIFARASAEAAQRRVALNELAELGQEMGVGYEK